MIFLIIDIFTLLSLIHYSLSSKHELPSLSLPLELLLQSMSFQIFLFLINQEILFSINFVFFHFDFFLHVYITLFFLIFIILILSIFIIFKDSIDFIIIFFNSCNAVFTIPLLNIIKLIFI